MSDKEKTLKEEKYTLLSQIFEEGKNIAFFGGAGVSTESGIPDFRSVDGLYNQKYDFPPEKILSHSFFMENPSEFYRFYKDKIIIHNTAQPNTAHKVLAYWEKEGKLSAVVTQNIDGLHQAAGSKCVLELHGSIHRNYCVSCGEKVDLNFILSCENIPRCRSCNGIIRPDVTLYEESLDQKVMEKAIRKINEADVLLVAGTSLSVYPAAGLVQHFRGKHLVVINMTPTDLDQEAELCIHQKVGFALSRFLPESDEKDFYLEPVKTKADISAAAAMAKEIWFSFYTPIIGNAQVTYMTENFQSEKAIEKQIKEENYQYFFMNAAGDRVGYVALLFENNKCFLSKFYMNEKARGRGYGRKSIQEIEKMSLDKNAESIWLTVNKFNPTLRIYDRLGFRNMGAQQTDIGNGFIMDDFLMEKKIYKV